MKKSILNQYVLDQFHTIKQQIDDRLTPLDIACKDRMQSQSIDRMINLRGLLKRCFEIDPRERPLASELKEHLFF